MSLLTVDRLHVRYGSGRTSLTAVDDVSLEVEAGASLGVVGESGSGKSTLARAIVQIVPSFSGSILMDGRDVTNARGAALKHLRARIQMVFQDPFATLNPRLTIGSTLEEAIRIREQREHSRGARANEVESLLKLVTLGRAVVNRYPNELSGGQLQRVCIARALAAKPELLILDEVTSALDVSVQAAILNLLRDLRDELGLSYLCISHDLSVISYLCERVMVLYLGQTAETGTWADLATAPRHPYTRTLLDSVPQVSGDPIRTAVGGDVADPRHPPAGCRFHPRCPVGPLAHPERTACRTDDPHLIERTSDSGHAACHFPLSPHADVRAAAASKSAMP